LINDFCFSPNGKMIACCTDQKIKIFHIKDFKIESHSCYFGGNNSKIISLQFSNDNRFVLAVTDDKIAKLFNVRTLKKVLSLKNVSTAFIADENLVYSKVNENCVHVLEFPAFRFSMPNLMFSQTKPQIEEKTHYCLPRCDIF